MFVATNPETMAARGATSVTIEGSNDKRMIAGTFAITLSGNFLPIQLIYAGKTKQSIPRVSFPKEFTLSANPTHFSNAEESLKFLNEVINPYVEKERLNLNLPKDQKALMIMDVFTGQMTEQVTKQYQDNNILVVNVPRNMTKYYQPLDLTVNGYCKSFLKRMFTRWYASQVSKQLANKVPVDEVQVKLQLSTMKPIHAGWIIDFYNEMTTTTGIDIIKSGWASAGITDAIKIGLEKLPSIDPFEELDPMICNNEDAFQMNIIRMTAIACLSKDDLDLVGPNEKDDDESDGEEWVAPAYADRGAFDMFGEENL